MAEHIGTVYVDVEPDASGFVSRFEAQTGAGMSEAGRRAGNDWQRGFEESTRGNSPTIRPNVDTTAARAQIAELNRQVDNTNTAGVGLIGTLATLAPAAVPIAAVLGGAFVGLIPTIATVALGVKGIAAEMKSGALEGTQYGKDLHGITVEGQKLQAIAAGGLLSGIDRGLAASHGLFHVVNSDVQVMSNQLGNIVAGAAPALLHILVQLNPLFTTFGHLLADGAQHLEHWATSSNGISSFVQYVQAELPDVMHLLGNLVVLFSHLLQGAAPFGGVMLHSLVLFTDALNAIPVGVLRVLVPLAVEARLAFMAWRLIGPVIQGVGKGFSTLTTQVQAFSQRNNLAMIEVQAAEKQTAAEVAAAERTASISRLQAAQQAVGAAREEVTAAESVGEAETEAAQVILRAKEEEAAAAKTAADAAILSARKTAAASKTASEEVAATREASAAGMSALLPGIGAVVGGLALLGTAFLGSSESAQQATQANQNYAESVKQSTDALNQANIAATNKNLSDAQAFDQLDRLKAANAGVTLTYHDLGLAVNGSAEQYQKLKQALAGRAFGAESVDAGLLIGTVTRLRGELGKNLTTQKQLNEAQRQSVNTARNGSAAATEMASSLGASGKEYLAARAAAEKNTAQTRQQTLAFQYESNAASLLNQALQTLRGQDLNVAQAHTALDQSIKTVISSMAKGKTAIHGMTTEALNNQQGLQGVASNARATATAVAQQTHSNDQAIASYKASKQALLDDLQAHNELTPAVQAYVNKLFDVKGVSDYLNAHPTKVDVQTRGLDDALAQVRGLQTALNQLHNKSITVTEYTATVKGIQTQPHAAGGSVSDGWFTVGEEGGPHGWELGHKSGSDVQIYSNAQARAMTGMDHVPGYAAGTNPNSTPVSYIVLGQSYSTLKQAEKAADKAFRAQLHLGVTIDNHDLKALEKSIKGTAQNVHQAFSTVLGDLKQLNAPEGLIRSLRAQDDALAHSVKLRDQATNHLQAVQQKDDQLQASIRQAIASSFDVTTAGANANGKVTAGGILAQETQAANRDRQFVADMEKLTKLIPGPYVRQLASKGPDALPEAEALLHMSKSQLTAFRNEQQSIAATGSKLARFEGKHFYGDDIAKFTREQDKYAREAREEMRGLRHDIREATRRLEHRPIEIKVDGKVIARVTASGARKNGRRT